ncbi:uncharacterized protein EMH_0041570 [Eimeria mitis]|uniref:Serine aminopeptidase S33 domain-containing protein n=1 Tax=Eimeria mitis TaxID=44415 RepID=U6K9D9_9EIME|nr:uncharacterized protein EMH_0041570 [Eimeria mitis]CDJ32098.1 hypothetical protein, conserved [Eimeria mitis]
MPLNHGPSNAVLQVVLVVFVLLVFTAGIVWLLQEKLLFFNAFPLGHKTPSLNPRGIRNPGERGTPYRDVSITTRDGYRLNAWLLLQDDPLAVPTFIFFHGNAGNMGFHLNHADHIRRAAGVNVLLLDYRGYGNSEGTPTEKGVYADADAALDFLLNSSLVDSENIFAFGHSLGGAVAIDLASRRGNELKGVVVENTFTSLRDMVHTVCGFTRQLNWLLNIIQRMKLESEEKVRRLNIPVLFISGGKDSLVPPSQMDKLYHACTSNFKWRLDVPNGEHNDTWLAAGPVYGESIEEFIEASIAASTQAWKNEAAAGASARRDDIASTDDSAGRTEGETREKMASSSSLERRRYALPDAFTASESGRSYNSADEENQELTPENPLPSSRDGGTQRMTPEDPSPSSSIKLSTMVFALLILALLMRRKLVKSRAVSQRTEGEDVQELPSSTVDLPYMDLKTTDLRELLPPGSFFFPSYGEVDTASEASNPASAPVEPAVEEPDVEHLDASTS